MRNIEVIRMIVVRDRPRKHETRGMNDNILRSPGFECIRETFYLTIDD